jgi:hypothetical protein
MTAGATMLCGHFDLGYGHVIGRRGFSLLQHSKVAQAHGEPAAETRLP